MKMRFLLAATTCAFCLSQHALAQDVPSIKFSPLQEIKERGVLVVGVRKDVPHWGMLNPNSKDLEGLEVDLAKELASELGLRIRLLGLLSAEKIEAIDSKKVDVLIASVANTPDKIPHMTFVMPHYHASGTSVIARKSDNFRNWDELRNKRICSTRNEHFNRTVSLQYGADVVALYSARTALQALRDGRCAGFLHGDTQISSLLSDPLYKDRYEMALPAINLTPWAIVIHRQHKDTDLNSVISSTIIKWYKEGLISRLQKKWGVSTPEFINEREKLWQNGFCGTKVTESTPSTCL